MTDITTPQAPVTERATDPAAGVKDQAATIAATAADEAKAVASEAAAEAKDLFADARHQLRIQANDQADKVAALVGDIGAQLRSMAEAGESGVAKDVVTTVADQAEGISNRLSDGGLDRTLEDARRLARNRPGLFLAGAALVGFVAARVARTVDTGALKEAVAPTNGHTNGIANAQELPVGQTPAVAPPPVASGPAPDPRLGSSTATMPMPPVEGPR